MKFRQIGIQNGYHVVPTIAEMDVLTYCYDVLKCLIMNNLPLFPPTAVWECRSS